MDTEFEFKANVHREQRYIHTTAKGKMSLKDLKQMFASVLKHPQYKSGMNRLWDFNSVDVSLLTRDDIESFVKFIKNKNIGTDNAYTATVVSREFEYGMIQMLQGVGDEVISPNALVTKSKDKALKWVTNKSAGNASN